jgi:ubiquinone/menaquinone biosynthesis C-methylase UbiE
MIQIRAEKPSDIPQAYSRYYTQMADHFARLIKPIQPRLVLEAGCGRGQLTLPLLRKLPRNCRLIGVDSAKRPYADWLGSLELKLSQANLTRRVQLVKADARQMRQVPSHTIDFLFSNELLCDLTNENQLTHALGEFHRVLRPRGLMVHGEWTSFTGGNSDALGVKHSPSWTPDQLFLLMNRSGFRNFATMYFDVTISFGYNAAREELRSWGASPILLRQNDRMLRKHGLQLPIEHIVRCEK